VNVGWLLLLLDELELRLLLLLEEEG